jgi:hypothetical protein
MRGAGSSVEKKSFPLGQYADPPEHHEWSEFGEGNLEHMGAP